MALAHYGFGYGMGVAGADEKAKGKSRGRSQGTKRTREEANIEEISGHEYGTDASRAIIPLAAPVPSATSTNARDIVLEQLGRGGTATDNFLNAISNPEAAVAFGFPSSSTNENAEASSGQARGRGRGRGRGRARGKSETTPKKARTSVSKKRPPIVVDDYDDDDEEDSGEEPEETEKTVQPASFGIQGAIAAAERKSKPPKTIPMDTKGTPGTALSAPLANGQQSRAKEDSDDEDEPDHSMKNPDVFMQTFVIPYDTMFKGAKAADKNIAVEQYRENRKTMYAVWKDSYMQSKRRIRELERKLAAVTAAVSSSSLVPGNALVQVVPTKPKTSRLFDALLARVCLLVSGSVPSGAIEQKADGAPGNIPLPLWRFAQHLHLSPSKITYETLPEQIRRDMEQGLTHRFKNNKPLAELLYQRVIAEVRAAALFLASPDSQHDSSSFYKAERQDCMLLLVVLHVLGVLLAKGLSQNYLAAIDGLPALPSI